MPPGVREVIRTPDEAWDLAIGGGAVWAQVGDTGAVRIDLQTKRVTARVPGVGGLAFRGSELWAAAIDRVLLLDPTSGAVLETIPVGADAAFHIVTSDAAVWVSGFAGVTRIDPVTHRADPTIALPTCAGIRSLAVGHGSVWVGCRDAGAVVRVDAATRAVVATIPTGRGAHHVAVGANAVWVTNYLESTVSRVDPATNARVAKVEGAGGGVGLAVSEGVVWAAASSGIAKIDPATTTIIGRIRLPSARFYYDIQLVDGSLWVSSLAGEVFRIDPSA